MQASQDRQAKMLESLLKQRDMYKNMYQQCVSQSSPLNDTAKTNSHEPNAEFKGLDQSNVNEKINDEIKRWQEISQETESKFIQISNDFEVYRKDKSAHEKMLNDEIERLREDAEKKSSRCCKLKAQLDSANERFSLLQGNVVTYKSQIKILEEKCNNYSVTIGKFITFTSFVIYFIIWIYLFHRKT